MKNNPVEFAYAFSTLCMNVRSLFNITNFSKFEGLVATLDYKPNVIGATETWKSSTSSGQFKSLSGYTYVYN